MAFVDGLRLAVTTFTVVPVRPGRVDRRAAAVAMSLAAAVGAALGLALGAVLIGLFELGTPPLVAGGVTVTLAALLTRGLHLDGLADTMDGLGSYRTGDAALAVMRKPDVGPFGVAALVLALLVQAAALAGLADRGGVAALATVGTATAAGRLAATWACRRGVPAARPDGLGALVAGTVGRAPLAVATAAVVVLAVPAVPDRPWQGPAAVLLALAAALLFTRHAVRRFGGITGDVLGAAIELTTTLTYVALS
ncbi:adenosylcobinamide-GDP ribazoletransferase [Actinomycetes bacterium KLBMP 9797]